MLQTLSGSHTKQKRPPLAPATGGLAMDAGTRASAPCGCMLCRRGRGSSGAARRRAHPQQRAQALAEPQRGALHAAVRQHPRLPKHLRRVGRASALGVTSSPSPRTHQP